MDKKLEFHAILIEAMYKKLEFYDNLFLGDDNKLYKLVEGKMVLLINSTIRINNAKDTKK